MAAITVRAARPGDGPAIAQIHLQAARYYVGLAPDDFRIPDQAWAKNVPGRPAHFTLDGSEFANYECFGPSYQIRFVEQGRVFQAHVSFGEDAPSETKARALDVLESLEVAATP